MVSVELTSWEYKHCVDVANARMAISNDKKMNHASTYERDHLTRTSQEILGACGEMAVCKHLGKFWSPSVNTFHHIADIEPNIEVRTTDNENGCLIVRDNDADDRYYFLVIGTPPRLTIRGYIKGADAKKPQYMRNPHSNRPAWFVPQHALNKVANKKQPTTRSTT